MLGMLIAYDADGEIIATEDLTVYVTPDGRRHLVDVAAYERTGGKLRALWHVPGAVGSASWPEYLGEQVHDFRVEVDKRHKLRARRLIHKQSGHVRHRDLVDDAVRERRQQAQDGPADIRDLVGGPGKPIHVDHEGKTVRRAQGDAPSPLPSFLRHAVKGPEKREE